MFGFWFLCVCKMHFSMYIPVRELMKCIHMNDMWRHYAWNPYEDGCNTFGYCLDLTSLSYLMYDLDQLLKRYTDA